MKQRFAPDFLLDRILHRDGLMLVIDKPAGLPVHAKPGAKGDARGESLEDYFDALRFGLPRAPALAHRLDRDTTGCLILGRHPKALRKLHKLFFDGKVDKTYWAICKGVPRKREGEISTWLVKERTPEGDKMRVAKHGEPDADHAVSKYRVIDQAGQNLSWLELKPVTGRTHQLRIHTSHLGNPIIGDPKYFDIENWEFPGGIQKKLHLHARRIQIRHPDGGILDVRAPLPPHMIQTFNLLGLDEQIGEENTIT